MAISIFLIEKPISIEFLKIIIGVQNQKPIILRYYCCSRQLVQNIDGRTVLISKSAEHPQI